MNNKTKKTADLFEKINGVSIIKYLENEEYISNIRNILLESGGINDDVKKITNAIVSKIVQLYKNLKDDDGFYPLAKGLSGFSQSIMVEILNIPISVICHFFLYNDERAFFNFLNNHTTYGTYFDNHGAISVVIPIINECIDTKSLYGNIQHEVEHAFQYIKSGGSQNAKKEKLLYNKSVAIMKNGVPYSVDFPKCALATAIYGSNPSEMNGFINTLNAELSQVIGAHNDNKLSLDEKLINEIQNSLYQKILNCIKVSIDNLKNDDGKLMTDYSAYISKEKLLKRLEKNYKIMLLKLGRMLSDFSDKHNIDLLRLSRLY